MTLYPPVGFHFAVRFGISDQDNDTRFQSVSGLSVEYETETINEGGENRFVYEIPVRTSYSNLVLKRGMMVDSTVVQWCIDAFENRSFQPTDLQVILLNENHEPLRTWSVVRAWPKRWSVSDFNAEDNSIVIETLELSYRYYKLM